MICAICQQSGHAGAVGTADEKLVGEIIVCWCGQDVCRICLKTHLPGCAYAKTTRLRFPPEKLTKAVPVTVSAKQYFEQKASGFKKVEVPGRYRKDVDG